MAPRKTKADGEEKAKPVTTVSSRVTRSMDCRTRSETQKNGAKVSGSVTKIESPKVTKRKKAALEPKKSKKVKKEEEAVEEVEKEEETTEVEDSTKQKIVIEHCKQCNAFKTRAIQVKEALEKAVPGFTVTLNPDKPRRGCFEIREEGGETFISLLDMKRPFAPMKALDMEEVIEDIIKKIK